MFRDKTHEEEEEDLLRLGPPGCSQAVGLRSFCVFELQDFTGRFSGDEI